MHSTGSLNRQDNFSGNDPENRSGWKEIKKISIQKI